MYIKKFNLKKLFFSGILMCAFKKYIASHSKDVTHRHNIRLSDSNMTRASRFSAIQEKLGNRYFLVKTC